VGDPNRQLAARQLLHDLPHHPAALEDEFDLVLKLRHPPGAILRHGLHECVEALRRMMEVGDRLVKLAGGEVEQAPLEHAEATPRFEELAGTQHLVVGGGVFDEVVGAPEAASRVLKQRVAAAGGHQRQHVAPGVHVLGQKPRAQVAGDALDVVHHLGGVLEHVAVDVLQRVVDLPPAHDVAQVEGAVDVAGVQFLNGQVLALKGEFRQYVLDLVVKHRLALRSAQRLVQVLD